MTVMNATEHNRTEEALREAKQLYESVVENTSAIILRVDPSAVITFANRRALEFFGYSADELIGKHAVGTIVPPRETTGRDLAQMVNEIALDPDRFRANANENICKDGHRVWVEWTNSGIYDEEGRLKEFLSVGIDATDRKRAEESEQRLIALMNHNPSLVFLKDACGRYVYLNEAYEKRFALTKDWLGKTDYDFWGEESAELFRANDAEVLRSGKTQQFLEDSTDRTGKRYCWLCYKFPFTDSKGAKYVGGVGIDATARVVAEEALRKNELRYRTLVKATSAVTWSCPPSGFHVEAQPEWMAFTGQSAEEMLGDGWTRAVHHEDLTDVATKWQEAVVGGEPYANETRIRRHDGEWRWMNVRIAPVRDGSGEIVEWFGMNIDVTERKKAEEALRQSESRAQADLADSLLLQQVSTEMIRGENGTELYRSIVEAAAAVMKSDFASVQVLELVGLEDGELQLLAHKGFGEKAVKFWDRVKLSSQSPCGAALRRRERVVVPDVRKCEFMAGTQDQAICLATGIHAVQTTPLVTRTGKLVGMISTHWKSPHLSRNREFHLLDVLARQAADLLERNQAEEALRQSEERMRCALAIETVGVLFFRLDGRLVDANAAFQRMSGYTVEELRTLDWKQLTPPEFAEITMRTAQNLSERGETQPYEKQHIRKDGTRWWGLFAPKRLSGAGLHSECVEFIIDITERKRAELELATTLEELRHAQQELVRQERLATLGRLAGSVAHEMRTPLTVIRSSLFFLERSYPTEDRNVNEALGELKRAIVSSDHIISEMLDYVREPSPCDSLFPIENAIAHALRLVSIPKTVHLRECSVDGVTGMTVRANQDQITRILVNLIQNAVQAMPAGGELNISSGLDGAGKIGVSVRDSGCGIPAENLSKIFEPLFSTKTVGIGLGLAIAKRYAELNGGELSVESEPGGGTTFRLNLKSADHQQPNG